MLHITNGDAVANKLRQSGLEGTFLPWREDYTEGPVAADMGLEPVRRERSRFFADAFGVPEGLFAANREEQEAALQRAAAEGDEIVLWFEHDLYDQTMLAYLLHRLSLLEAEGANPPLRLQLICIGSYPGIEPFHGLGQLRAEQLAALYPGRRPVTAGQLALGRLAWEAYASPDPRAVEALLQQRHAADAELPFLREANAIHLQRFPSTADGLGRVERSALEAIAAGATKLIPLFQAATYPLTVYGIGDLAFWACLERLRSGPRPLIRLQGSGSDAFPRFGGPGPDRAAEVCLTPDGRDVLAGRADHVRLNGISRILGGVRLSGKGPLWRYDAAQGRLVLA